MSLVCVPPSNCRTIFAGESWSEAAARNLRGYSPVIVDALRAYFDGQEDDRQHVVTRVRGSLGAHAAEVEDRRLAEVRANWRT